MTLENLNMITRNLLTKSAVLLALLLTIIRGALLSCAVRFGNAESFAQTVTEFTPSSSRDTTPVPKSRTPSPASPPTTISKFENPQEKLAAIAHGDIPLDDVSMAEWVQLVTIHMASNGSTHLNVDIPYKEGVYLHHHCIERIKMPPVGPVWETKH